jgi:hypothetical protein
MAAFADAVKECLKGRQKKSAVLKRFRMKVQ